MRSDGSLSLEDMVKEYNNGKNIIILPLNLPKHNLTVALVGGKLILSNHGLGMLETGITIFDIKDKSKITKEFLQRLSDPKKFNDIKEILAFLAEQGIDVAHGKSIPSKEQGQKTRFSS